MPAERPRLCLILNGLERGGLEKQACLLATGLARRGFEVAVISLSEGGAWAETLKASGVPVTQLTRRSHFDLARLMALAAVFRDLRPDLVYAFNFPTTVYARLAGLLASVPVLITGERGIYLTPLQAILERALARATQCVICNADAIRRHFVERVGIPALKVITIRNGLEIRAEPGPPEKSAARALLKIPEESFVVGTVGHLEDVKNLPMLVEVARLARDEGLAMRFCVVGAGRRLEALRSLIRERGVDDRFILTGERAAGDDLLPAFDVFVLTSKSEGLPNTIMEAMAASLPCVCTDVGGCDELVEEGVTGFLVPSDDAAAMVRRLRQLAADVRLRESMGKAGRARILRDFSADRLLSETEAVLRELLAARTAGPRGRRLPARPAPASE